MPAEEEDPGTTANTRVCLYIGREHTGSSATVGDAWSTSIHAGRGGEGEHHDAQIYYYSHLVDIENKWEDPAKWRQWKRRLAATL